jgi:FkbH-like protein
MTGAYERFASIKQEIRRQDYVSAFRSLCALMSSRDDFATQAHAAKLLSSIPVNSLELKPIRIALVGSSTLDQFADLLRLWLAVDGLAAELWIAPFDTVVPTVLDTAGELYGFNPDVVWLFSTHRDIRLSIPMGDDASVGAAVQAAVASRVLLWNALRTNLGCVVVDNNADIPANDVLGNFAGQAYWSQRNSLHRYNLELAAAATDVAIIFDLDHLSSLTGKAGWVDHRYWYHSKNAISFEALGAVALTGARMIGALKGLAKKCLVLDLDNTLWGGVIGDDGWEAIKLGAGSDGEAFVDVQRWAKRLKERGIILAVCSKNEIDIAKEPFVRHPDMHLTLDDIAVFRANWENKADNIRNIAETLNIGLDSIVFVDDNPVERNLVRHHLPMVSVPELPSDPSGYVKAIEAELYFETTTFSPEDMARARYYRDNAERSELKASFKSQEEYLRNLDMAAETGSLDSFHLPRIAQLVNKSNQFNLTTIRYTEADLLALASQNEYAVRHYKLIDRYGDNGLISVVVLKRHTGASLGIDLWVMSCRVLARTMEEFICNDIIAVARQMRCSAVVGRYLPTAKNKLVSGLYERLGFTKQSEGQDGTLWSLAVGSDTKPHVTYVADGKLSSNNKDAHA